MKAIGFGVLAIALSTVAVGQTYTQTEAQELRVLSNISRAEVATLRALAEATDPALLGFESAAEIEQVVIGTPIKAYMIGLEPLQQYEASSASPQSLLIDIQEVTVPLNVGDTARSGITLSKDGDTWTPVSFGGANFVRLMSDLRRELAARDGTEESVYFEVRVPALNVFFIGVERDQRLYLAALLDDPRFELTRGEVLPAEVVLERLQPAAREHNGLPT